MKKRGPGSVVLFMAFIICISMGGYVYVKKYMPNYNIEPYYKHIPNWKAGEISILVEDEPIDNPTAFERKDGITYVPIDFVTNHIDEFIYWENSSETLIHTTPDKVYKFKANEKEYTINKEKNYLETEFIAQDNIAYIPEDFIEYFYNVDIKYVESTSVVIVDYKDNAHTIAKIKPRKGNIRFKANIKSPIAEKVDRNAEIYLYGAVEDGWTKIRTSSGIVGYIQTKDIKEITNIETIIKEEIQITPMWKAEHGKINLLWDQVFEKEDSESQKKRERHPGVDVLSPTWFSVVSKDGEIRSIASKKYVEWAHENGIKVWALIDNSFDAELTHEFLSTFEIRQKIINQMIALAKEYNLDGINIDFEEFSKDDGKNFVQFVKEAAPALRAEGLVVSVDVNVPKPWTAHFKRGEISKSIDYLMVMAYDEYWATAPESGPVASLNWSKEGIENTLLEEVPKEKILLGIPFYNRIWKEQPKKTDEKPTSLSYAMQTAFNILEENNAEIIWLQDMSLYYGEYTDGDVIYKCWLENEETLEKKVELVIEHDIAGVAGWKRGLEREEVWGMLEEKLNKTY